MNATTTQVRSLIELTGKLCADPERVLNVCRAMRLDPDREAPRASTLNDDGSPLELCVTSGPEGCRYRMIGDPEPEELDCRKRLHSFRDSLRELLPLCGAASLEPWVDAAVGWWLPEDDEGLARVVKRIRWVAAGVDTPGVGFYLDGRVGSLSFSWDRGREWFDRVLPDASLAKRFMTAFEDVGGLGGVGIEGVTPDTARAKFHWGLVSPIRIDLLDLPLLGDQTIREFFHIMVDDKEFKVTCPTFSAGFDLKTGELADVKVDLCACPHCLNLSPAELVARIGKSCRAYDLCPPPVSPELLAGVCQGVYLGLGLSSTGQHRLNLYLK